MEESPLEFANFFEICYDLLSRSHINILKKTPSPKILLIVFLFCSGALYISLLMYTRKFFSEQADLFELGVSIPIIVFGTQSILKAVLLLASKSKIRDMTHQLGASWRLDNLTAKQIKIKEDMLKKLRIFHSGFYLSHIYGAWVYMLAPFLETLFRRFILHDQSSLLLPFCCSLPFDLTKNWIRYIAVYIYMVYFMFKFLYIFLGCEMLIITFCGLLSIEFCLLQEDLRCVKPLSKRNSLGERTDYNGDVLGYNHTKLEHIIQRHQWLIKLTDQLNEIFNKIVFINLLSATSEICFFAFIASIARLPADIAKSTIAATVLILVVFSLCYFSEILTGASTGIADAAYENKWYEGNIGHRKILSFIIMRSHRPCCLKSLKFAPVSLKTFTSVMSTTWSYFSLVINVYKENNA